MKILLTANTISHLKTDLLILPVAGKKRTEKGAKKSSSTKKTKQLSPLEYFEPGCETDLRALEKRLGNIISPRLETFEYRPASAKRIEIQILEKNSPFQTVRLSGVSNIQSDAHIQLDEWRRLGGDAVQSAKRLKAKRVSVCLWHTFSEGQLEKILEAVVEGALLGCYEFTRFKGTGSKKPNPKINPTPELFEVILEKPPTAALKKTLERARIIAEATSFARDLVNTPPSDMVPAILAKHAKQIASTKGSRVKAKIYNKTRLTRMKAFSLLGVSRGSESEPYLIHLCLPAKKKSARSKRITLIGKGVTFDSGGLSIKTGKGMEDMKCDMSGAACVLAVMKALIALQKSNPLEHEVHILIPTTENMINGASVKPGDVLTAMNGKTIEVLNTDAEGRLILADALSYAGRWKSDLIVDLATLTGACVVALGSDYAGMFSNSQEYADKLKAISSASGERLWQLPLAEEYRPQMESDVADLRNIGTGGPGAIIGALFLKEFVPANTPWVHLDIAGPAFVTKSNEYIKRGGTGFGVLTLLRLLDSL